jgi:hypothetical protein
MRSAVLYARRSVFFRSVIQTARCNFEQGYIHWPEAKRTLAQAFRPFSP